jgi:hypothetical protein
MKVTDDACLTWNGYSVTMDCSPLTVVAFLAVHAKDFLSIGRACLLLHDREANGEDGYKAARGR